MKIKDLIELMGGVNAMLINLYSEKDNKPYKLVQYYEKETLIEEIGDLEVVGYDLASFHDIPLLIIRYATPI